MDLVGSFLLANAWKVAVVVSLPIIGALAQHLWSRWRNRLTELRWTVSYTPMAFATDDFGWGKVEILYDGRPTKNLHIANVHLQNASSRDLQNLLVDIAGNEGTTVLRSSGQITGSLQYFPFAPRHADALKQVIEGTIAPNAIPFVLRRSDLQIPVMNRGAIAHIRLLLSREDYETPSLSVGCDHAGVRIRHQPLAVEVLGVRQNQAVLVGLLLSIGISAALAITGVPVGVVAAVAWTVGATAQHVGAAGVRLARGLLSMVD